MAENTQIEKSEVNQKLANFHEFGSIEKMKALASEIVKSNFTPLKTEGDVIAALLYGKELNLPPMQSVNNIYPINGKATAGVHLITALLLRAGVKTEVLEDYTPLYRFADSDKNVYGEEEVLAKKGIFFQIVSPSTPKEEYVKGLIQVIMMQGKSRIGDRRTKIKFSRKLSDGSIQELIVSRTLEDYGHLWKPKEEGGQAKDNWITNPKGMLFNRILAVGGRAIASDALLGILLTDELGGEEETNINDIKYQETTAEEVTTEQVVV